MNFASLGLLSLALTEYHVTLHIDPEAKVLRGHEEIRFASAADVAAWARQSGLRITKHSGASFDYEAEETRGFRWFTGGPGLFTAFHCEAWMICSADPAARAILKLEIVVPKGLTAAGPGQLRKRWSDAAGDHFHFETGPVQTYLFSFAVAPFVTEKSGELAILARDGGHPKAFEATASAAAFFREIAGVDAIPRGYTQAFTPQRGLGQEAAESALMSEDYLARLERDGDTVLLAHELAHQWWGVQVGIRSWSDFWLNEGFAEFMSHAYSERTKGRPAYDTAIAALRKQMDELRAKGSDEKWKDATGALGPVPYVKGALFLDRLRRELGEAAFWRGVKQYTSAHAGQLVDSRDFQKAMEKSAGRELAELFKEVFE